MDQRHASETYRSHSLKVTAFEVRPGWWSWSYLIDGKISGSSTARSAMATSAAALQRGMHAARARADELG